MQRNNDVPGRLHDNNLLITARRCESLIFAIFLHRCRRLCTAATLLLLMSEYNTAVAYTVGLNNDK